MLNPQLVTCCCVFLVTKMTGDLILCSRGNAIRSIDDINNVILGDIIN